MKIIALVLLLLPFALFAQNDIKPMKRKGVMFKLVQQRDIELSPTTGKYGYTIVIKNSKGEAVSNVNVHLIDVDNKIKYQTVSNANGEAKFLVDSGSTYEIDLEKQEAVKILTTKRVKYGSETVELVYKK